MTDVERIHSLLVDTLTKAIGDRALTGEEVIQASKDMDMKTLHSIYSLDQAHEALMHKRLPVGAGCIINTDIIEKPGEHWFCVYRHTEKVLFCYDSFGNPCYDLFERQLKDKAEELTEHYVFIDAEEDAEQEKDELNCGIQSLVWLYIVENIDPVQALLI